ncbi:MAG: hypothetical protein AMJ79_07715 [Phycisphaerae bacterium SM23_30]|nr:MAG: hypothetical protein AMJ79_07715 [Phycisphaerae bacterium SM23_30]
MGRRGGHELLELLYPPNCPGCGAPIDDSSDQLCPACWQQLRQISPGLYCTMCGHNSGPYALIDGRCHRCQNRRPAVTRVLRVGPYQDVLRELILAFKFRRQSQLDGFLGRLLAAVIIGDDQLRRAHLLVPVPLHWRRRWARRYDQSELLARAVRKELERQNLPVPISFDLVRLRHTPPQTSMALSHRLINLKGAFGVRPDVDFHGKHLCLIDDVTTTGTTLRVAAQTLKKAGAERISAAVLAVAAND